MPNASHVLFFIGAGVSAPSGFPLADDMHQYIFGDDIAWHGLGAMRFGEPPKIDDGGKGRRVACEVRGFLRELQQVMKEALKPRNKQALNTAHPSEPTDVGYEDLYHACDQIEAAERGYGHSPAASIMADHVRETASSHLISYPRSSARGRVRVSPLPPNPYTDLAWTAFLSKVLIRSVVADHLSRLTQPEGLEAIVEAALQASSESGDVERVTIVTLNHDCLVEELLEEQGLSSASPDGFEDGFSSLIGYSDLRAYEPERLFTDRTSVRVLKPHGSINWYPVSPRRNGVAPVKPRGASRFSNKIGALSGPPPYDAGRDIPWMADIPIRHSIRPARPTALVPLLLTSFGKEIDYGRSIFGDMIFASMQALDDADAVFVSGFGWNDAGMRQRLLGSLRRSSKKRMFILHKRSEKEMREMRLAGGLSIDKADPFAERQQLYHFNEWLSGFSWQSLWARAKPKLP